MYYTYILKSLKDGKFYYGSTSDAEKRLAAHNSGQVKATRNRRPLVQIYREEWPSKERAIEREFFFKKRSGYRWLKENEII